MVTISKLTVTNAKRIDVTNWLTVRDVFGPQEIPDPSPRGDCVVQADTGPQNNAAEWSQIAWDGAETHSRQTQPAAGQASNDRKDNHHRINRKHYPEVRCVDHVGRCLCAHKRASAAASKALERGRALPRT